MKEPTTADEVAALHDMMEADPRRYLGITNGWIADNPSSATAYFSRHRAWMSLNQPEQAHADLNRAIELEPSQTRFWTRGDVFRHLGKYEEARDDYARAEAIDPANWERDAFPLIYQADVHARLGEEASALACCARLPEDFWTPGHNGLPPGGKSEIADALHRRAAAARTAAP
jgi:tetratricopeptide (TPR) repeat protein